MGVNNHHQPHRHGQRKCCRYEEPPRSLAALSATRTSLERVQKWRCFRYEKGCGCPPFWLLEPWERPLPISHKLVSRSRVPPQHPSHRIHFECNVVPSRRALDE